MRRQTNLLSPQVNRPGLHASSTSRIVAPAPSSYACVVRMSSELVAPSSSLMLPAPVRSCRRMAFVSPFSAAANKALDIRFSLPVVQLVVVVVELEASQLDGCDENRPLMTRWTFP